MMQRYYELARIAFESTIWINRWNLTKAIKLNPSTVLLSILVEAKGEKRL